MDAISKHSAGLGIGLGLNPRAARVRNERAVAKMMRVLGLEEQRQAWRHLGESRRHLQHLLATADGTAVPTAAGETAEDEDFESSSSSSDGELQQP